MFETYLAYEYHFASLQLLLAMLGMGAALRMAEFVEVLRRPVGFAAGLTGVLVVGPLLALATRSLFDLEPGIAMGLMLIAAVPGGTLSNILTYFARGNIALSISLTGAATLGCLVTTPLVLRLFASELVESDFEMPVGRISLEIVAFLLLPLVLGLGVGHRFPAHQRAFSRWAIRASLAVIVVMIVGSLGAGRVDAGAYGSTALVAMLVFCALLLLAGMLLGGALRLPRRDVVAIGIETSYRNTSLAILIKASLFPAVPGQPDPFADQVLFVALLYAGFSVGVVMLPLLIHRRMTSGDVG
ncbi:MAG: bile acid:sodium symporter [Deltaproteobacteria bacterium]|nr:bile acid:sodium symporter [Deltaproteobacteria bacterium]